MHSINGFCIQLYRDIIHSTLFTFYLFIIYFIFYCKYILLVLVMADQSQNQGAPGTSTPYPNWSQPMNWSYGK